MTFEKLSLLAGNNGLVARVCGPYHWQIMSHNRFPLVNVWPSKNKYGKAIELQKYTKSVPMTSNVGVEEDVIKFAIELQHATPDGGNI